MNALAAFSNDAGFCSKAAAGAGVIQPVLGLFVGPTRNREARRGGTALAGSDGNTLVLAEVPSGGLKRCTVARLAEAHRVINRPKARADRIVLSPFSLPTVLLLRNNHRPRAIMPRAATLAVPVKPTMCARTTTAASHAASRSITSAGSRPHPPARFCYRRWDPAGR